MNPPNGKRFPGIRDRLMLAMRVYRPIAWLVFLSASLVLFIAWMPSQMRMIIWRGLVARGVLSSMLLVFSLLAVSLVWSVGQRVDVWAFLFFNLRGTRPVWLDRTMLGFTQIGSGIAALVIGFIMFLVGDRLGAYELFLGTLTLWIVVELVNALVRRSRPIIRVTQARLVGYRAGGRSFPSGHTSHVFFMATLMASHFHASLWLVILLYAIALLVGITRMYVGRTTHGTCWQGLSWAALGDFWECLSTDMCAEQNRVRRKRPHLIAVLHDTIRKTLPATDCSNFETLRHYP